MEGLRITNTGNRQECLPSGKRQTDRVEGKPEFVTIARIRRTQGRKGEVIAEILTDFPERFAETPAVVLEDAQGNRRNAQLDSHWFHKGQVVLKFAGVDDISTAETLAGNLVQVPFETRRQPADPAACFVSDLEGCRVVERGEQIGCVRYLDTTVGTPVLVVDTGDGRELLIPFAEAICKRIDTDARLIEVELPEGLRELNG